MYEVRGVGSIFKQVGDIAAYHGRSEETNILIAKAIIAGSAQFSRSAPELPYRSGTVLAKRAEGVLIQHSLKEAMNMSRDITPKEASRKVLSADELSELMQESYIRESQILPQLAAYLAQDNRRAKLMQFGLEVSARQEANYTIPETVDLTKLKERTASAIEKKIFREFSGICDVVNRL